MTAVWDGDTGTVTMVAKAKNPETGVIETVNLAGATTLTVITRSLDTGVSANLTIDSGASDLPNGKVVAAAEPLGVGTYKIVLRAVDGTGTATYPSADEGAEKFDVHPDLDA